MVTILPFDMDDEVIAEGIACAAAIRIAETIDKLAKMVAELKDCGYVDRAEWDGVFARLATLHTDTLPALEYAHVFEADDATDEA